MTLKTFEDYNPRFELEPEAGESYEQIDGDGYKIYIPDTWEQFVEILTTITGDINLVKGAMAHNKSYYEMYTPDNEKFVIVDVYNGPTYITNTKHTHISDLDDNPVSIRFVDDKVLKPLLSIYIDYRNKRA